MMGRQCTACLVTISRTKPEPFVTCVTCTNVWHCKCLNIIDDVIYELKTNNQSWACTACDTAKQNNSTQSASRDTIEMDYSSQHANTADINTAISLLKADLNKLKSSQQQFGEC